MTDTPPLLIIHSVDERSDDILAVHLHVTALGRRACCSAISKPVPHDITGEERDRARAELRAIALAYAFALGASRTCRAPEKLLGYLPVAVSIGEE